MGSMRRLGWACAPLLTGALALGLLGAGPGAATSGTELRATAPKAQGTWGTPIRLGDAWSSGSPQQGVERGADYAVAMDGQGNGVALAAIEVNPRVDAEGRVPANDMANVVMRYVDGVWQEPEVIAAPFSATGFITPGDGSYALGPITVSVSEDGYAAIAVPGTYRDETFTKQYGVFLSTSHDITEPGSFTPWQRVSGSTDVLELFQRVPLAVGEDGHLVIGYFVRTGGYPHPDIAEGCFGGSYAHTGRISKDKAVLSTPRIMARCVPFGGDSYPRSPIDVAMSDTTATVAFVEGTMGCAERGTYPIWCSQVDLLTFDTRTGAWTQAVRALPIQAHESTLEPRNLSWYESVRVAASSGGTAVVGRLSNPTNSVRYINIPAGTAPEPLKYKELIAKDTWYYPSDVVIAGDGTALAAFDVDSCETYNYPYCDGLKRTFQVVEFTSTSTKTHDLYGPIATNWFMKYSNRIAMSLPPGESSLSRVVVAYTATAPTKADGTLGPGWIETRAWPFEGSSPERLPAPKGYGTALGAWPWSGPAVAAASTGAGLVLYRPDWEASDGIGLQAASEVWASGLDTANRAGVFPPVYVKAAVGVDKRIAVTGIRPFFYPEGGGEEAFFNRGAQPRAKMEVLVATGPTGYRVTDTPVCTTTYSQDGSASNRIGSIRGSGSCTITTALPSGTYTFVARTTLDGQTSTRSAPTAPITYTAPAAQQTITLTRLKAIGKGARVKFQIKGTATGFTEGSTLTVWVKAGSATTFTSLTGATIKLGKPDRQGKQAFTYTTKGKNPKPISVYVTSQDRKVSSTTRTIQ